MRIAKWFLEPALGAALVGWWLATAAHPTLLDVVPLRTQTEFTNAYAVAMAVGLGLAIAVSRFSPRGAIGLAVLVLGIQLLGWASRFSQTGWAAYGILIVLAGLLAWHAHGRIRLLAIVVAVPVALTVSALLNLAPLSLSGTWGLVNGAPLEHPDTLTGFIATTLGSLLGVALLWYNVSRIRMRWQRPRAASGSGSIESLSPRERDVYFWVARGMTNGEIASEAHIEESTVKSHVASVLAKLELTSRTAVVAHAYRTGELQPEPISS